MARPRGSGTFPSRTALLVAVAREARQYWLSYHASPTLAWVAPRVGYRPRGLESALRQEAISWTAIKADAARWHSSGLVRDSAA